ncbi:MAG: ribosome assembly RNA-binding protein YhbY [Deltaproteobacteria bacterium CG23_combo_of_CG06-09_8_20_14_all_60_8]|nr:MAG: ribosome assembly RNA-binding protein YhbY [Deltaproteobacteria bacterium CG23_combo_of_CG06-09_8_20_14_all_60_8]
MSKTGPKAKQLNGSQIRHLRGLGHHLSPVVMVGREGISPSVLTAATEVLLAHELIKVKVQQTSDVDRQTAAEELANRLKAAVVQVLGNTVLLYRENKDRKPDQKINLPE